MNKAIAKAIFTFSLVTTIQAKPIAERIPSDIDTPQLMSFLGLAGNNQKLVFETACFAGFRVTTKKEGENPVVTTEWSNHASKIHILTHIQGKKIGSDKNSFQYGSKQLEINQQTELGFMRESFASTTITEYFEWLSSTQGLHDDVFEFDKYMHFFEAKGKKQSIRIEVVFSKQIKVDEPQR